MKIAISQIIFFTALAFLFSQCSTAKFVDEGTSLLDGNKIEFVDDVKIKDKSLLEFELGTFYQQEPNSHIFWIIPREYFYFKNSDPGDTSWYNNWARNSIGEAPVFYDQGLARNTSNEMEKFLVNRKGFYDANVNFEENQKGHKTDITYKIKTGPQYYIHSIDYIGQDTSVVNILKSIRDESLVQPGNRIDANTFELEITRMVTELQNRGYANFVSNYIDIKGDSTIHKQEIEIFFQIYSPLPDTLHRQYRVGEVNVYTDYHNNQDLGQLDSTTIEGLNFFRQSQDYIVNTGLLNSKIYLTPGELLSRDNRQKTYRKLSSLGTYSFISMNSGISSSNDSLINYNIFLTPQRNEWVSDFGFDFNYSSVSSQLNRQLFGFSVNGELTNRNALGGSEQNTLSVDNGYEFNLDSLNLSTFSLGISDNLQIPKYIDLLGSGHVLNSIGILSDAGFEKIKDETTTNLNLGYNLVDIRNFYRIRSINASISYSYTPNPRKRFIFRQTNFALNSFDLEQRFLNNFGRNQLIINSFKDNLITGYLFNELSFIYNSVPDIRGHSHSILGSLEVSGGETFLANKLYNWISGSNSTWSFSENISFAKFVKAEIDTRWYREINENQSFAFRINGGLAVPFGGPDEVIPYIRQFSVGGPNSMRAWDQKELGPGTYFDAAARDTINTVFFQQGDVKLEFNAEYRFDILWLLEGALFLDIGNVWTLKNDPERPGAQITSKFYDQFAIGAGWGARWDFTYFNIRFDFGYKIRTPYENEDGSRWMSWSDIKNQKFGNFQVAINYPF